MKFSRVKQFLKSKKVIRTGACVLAAVIVTGGVGAYHVYGQKAKTAQETTQERDADTEDRFADAEDVLTQVLKTQTKTIMTRQQKRKKPFMWWLIRTEHPMRLL